MAAEKNGHATSGDSRCTGLQRRLITIEMFTLTVLVMLNNTGMFWYVITGIITSIERRFHFNSATMGRLLMAPELAPLFGLLFISHFSNRFNMPRITGALCIIYCIAMALFTLPEYILSFDDENAHHSKSNTTLLCVRSTGQNIVSDDASGKRATANTKAFGIMFGSLLLVGIAAYPVYTLPYSYLESNTQKSRTPLYIALVNMGWSTCPFLGLLLSAWCTSLYVDLKETSLEPKDPAWIGAWWLAVVIVAALGLLSTPFLFFFPKKMKTNKFGCMESGIASPLCKVEESGSMDDGKTEIKTQNGVSSLAGVNTSLLCQVEENTNKENVTNDDDTKQNDSRSEVEIASLLCKAEDIMKHRNNEEEATSDVYSWNGFLLSLKRLVSNPVYLMTIFGYVFWAQFGWGFAGFFPKFYEEVFSITAWEASISAGIVTGIGQTVGRVVTSVVVGCFKISLRKSFIMIIMFTALSVLVLIGTLFVGCDSVNLVGAPEDGSEFIVDQLCAAGCDCSGIPYTPVCDAGVTYFSPCHAGCLDTNITAEVSQTLYTQCNCTKTGTAMSGECKNECNSYMLYTGMVFLLFSVTSFCNPLIIVFTMRCVDPVDQTLAYGLCMFTIGLFGWLPAPQFYGAVIDTTCTVWEDLGGGVRGSCWVYDLVAFRQRFQGLSCAIRFLQFMCYCVVYFLGRKRFESWEEVYRDEDTAPTKKNLESMPDVEQSMEQGHIK